MNFKTIPYRQIMTDQKEKITPLQNSEDYEKLKADYEAKIEEKKDEVEKWKNTAIKSDDASLVKDKEIERLEKEKDDWRQEALSARKVYKENKKTQEQTDFLTEFKRLQAKKGLQWDEQKEQWIIAK